MKELIAARQRRERAVMGTLARGALATLSKELDDADTLRQMQTAVRKFARELSKVAQQAALDEWHAAAEFYLGKLGEERDAYVLLAAKKAKKRGVGRARAIKKIKASTKKAGAKTGKRLEDVLAKELKAKGVVNGREVVRDVKRRARHHGRRVIVTVMTESDSLGAGSVARHFKRRGVHLMKRWVTEGDADVCTDCDEYDDVEVGHDEEFEDGDPPLHPNCRCVLELKRSEDDDEDEEDS